MWSEIKLVKNPPYEKGKNSMVPIKMLKTEKGASDGITVHVYLAGNIYPSATVPLSDDLKSSFIKMDSAEESEFPPIEQPEIMPLKNQAVKVAPKIKIDKMNKPQLIKFIEDSGLEVDDDKLTKKELLEIAKDC